MRQLQIFVNGEERLINSINFPPTLSSKLLTPSDHDMSFELIYLLQFFPIVFLSSQSSFVWLDYLLDNSPISASFTMSFLRIPFLIWRHVYILSDSPEKLCVWHVLWTFPLLSCWQRLLLHFLAAQTQNNHAETILIATLLGQWL